MNELRVIIKSGQKNWSGKEFSASPAKLYQSFDDAVTALNSYHFWEYNEVNGEHEPQQKKQKIEIIHLDENQVQKLVKKGKVRW